MFLFEITGLRTPGADGPHSTERVPLPRNTDQPPGRGSSGNDRYGHRFLGIEIPSLDSGSAFLTTVERRFLELINGARQRGEVTENTEEFVRSLIFDRGFRLNVIREVYGQDIVDRLRRLASSDDELERQRAQQAGMLAALIAIPELTQLIGAIRAIQGELIDSGVKAMAADMLANARDLAQWLARTRARHGDTRDAYALAQAEGRGVSDIVGNIVTFLSDPTLSYNPSQILADAQSTANTVNRRNRTRREIRELEHIVNNADPNNPTQVQLDARRRLPDLRNSITSA